MEPLQAQKTSVKRIFSISLVTSLLVSAAIAIIVFLFGDFGTNEIKLLLTTLAIGMFSLTGLCSSLLYDKNRFVPVAVSGMIISFVGALFTTSVIWQLWRDLSNANSDIKVTLILSIASFSIAHSSIMLLIDSQKSLINIFVGLTVFVITTIGIMLIYLVINNTELLDGADLFYRLLGVLAVLDVLGTLLTPIVKKANS